MAKFKGSTALVMVQTILNQSRLITRGYDKGNLEIKLNAEQQKRLVDWAHEVGAYVPPWLDK